MTSEDAWDQTMEESFIKFLRYVNEAHKGYCKPRSGCQEGKDSHPLEKRKEEALKQYCVSISGETECVYGDGAFVSDDFLLTIFLDTEAGQVAAIFREWDYFKILEEKS